jgi:4-hydroxy-tetrahydrodipicolinate synthase
MFTGLYTAVITPFKNGKIDYPAYRDHIERQIAGGVDGIVPMGTTGESPTVSFEEHSEFIQKSVEYVAKRVKVIAGTGANSTDEAIWLSKRAEEAGVDAVLQVNPYYNKPTQKGLIAHFESVAASIKIPVVLYNIPGRTGINFTPEAVKELADRAPNVVAMKEASGDINQMMRLIEICGDRLTVLSGDDNLLLPLLGVGGKGVISVLANILPREVKSVIDNFNAGRIVEARRDFYKILPACRAMFYETNPIPVKAALNMMGYCSPELRLPMTELADENKTRLKSVLKEFGLI